MRIYNFEQGSEEWFAIRQGKLTASNFSKVISKGGGATRKSYLYQVASEILTNDLAENFTNASMQWGKETEPQARINYELENGIDVVQVGFIERDEYVGASPDGLVGEDGLLEIKCPKTTTQIETYISGKMPSCHIPQVQGQLWVAEREWCDFLSFDPRINGKASYFPQRIYRDEAYIKNLVTEVEKFKDELLSLIEKLSG